MSSVIFDSFKSLYNYYYQIGKDWTSPSQAVPEKGYACLVKIQIDFDVFKCVKGSFTEKGWVDDKGVEIREIYTHFPIEWKYDTSTKSSCTIL
jgi:hypothetical protein